MAKLVRLHGRRAFDQLFRQGRVWSDELVLLRALPNGLPYIRLGVVVGRRVGKATVRNKVRRRLREMMRLLPLAEGWDMVVVARPAAAAASYWQLREALCSLLRKAGLLLPPERAGG